MEEIGKDIETKVETKLRSTKTHATSTSKQDKTKIRIKEANKIMVKKICELSATHYEVQEAEAFKQKYIKRRDNMSRKRHLKLLDGDT